MIGAGLNLVVNAAQLQTELRREADALTPSWWTMIVIQQLCRLQSSWNIHLVARPMSLL
jgi:hypothetical protein